MKDGLQFLWFVLLGTLACMCTAIGILGMAGLVLVSTGHAEAQQWILVPFLGTLSLFAAAAILFGALIRALD